MVDTKEKILLISPYFPPDSAGTGFVMEELAESIQKSGRVVHVLAGQTQYCTTARYHTYKSRVSIHRIWHCYMNKNSKFGRIMNYLSFPIAVLFHTHLLRWADTIIIVSTIPTTIGLAPLLNKFFKKNVHYIWQDIYPDLVIHLGAITQSSLLARSMRWLNEKSLPYVDHIIVLCDDMKTYVAQHYQGAWTNNVVVINNWENPDEIVPLSKDNPWARVSGYYEKFIVLYSGNIGLFQDFDTIIQAAKLLQYDRNVVFLFVGEGGSKKDIQDTVRTKNLQNVDFMSYVPQEDYNKLLATADAHIVSLKPGMEQFGFPGKLYSSLAAGRPVLAVGRVGGELIRTVITHHIGLTASTAQELADNITRLKNDTDLRSTLGEQGRSVFLDKWSVNKATQQYMQLLKN